MYKIDLTGNKFGRLTVISFSHKGNRRRMYWNCICECGNKCIIERSHLRSGHSKSCGCLSKELIGNLNKKTGLTNTRLFYAYHNMKNRCYRESNKMYKHYGERGIDVFNEWIDKENGFEKFAKWSLENGYNENLTIDRKDNNKGYSPDNCRWVNKYVQANNKRNTHQIDNMN